MTNREWLHTLSDEDLASHLEICCNSCIFEMSGISVCHGADCRESIAEWLKQEREHTDDIQKMDN